MRQWEKLLSFNTPHEPRRYANALVRFHHTFSFDDRLAAAERAGWNVFQFPSEMLRGGDLLSDSGTTTLTAEQFSQMVLGDEAYGTNYGYGKLLDAVEDMFGIDLADWELYLFHQARPAEHALFSHLSHYVKKNAAIPSNGHFDTTRANIEASDMEAIDIPLQRQNDEPASFGGNMNIEALKRLLQNDTRHVPLVYATITNNTGGGQPVSIRNLRDIKEVCVERGTPFFLDACRFAENAWFVKEREKEYRHAAIRDIVRETFSLCDGFTISFKKDGLANMGGALAIRKDSRFARAYPGILEKIRDHQILTEGHPTYGGMSGRDIMTIAEGLRTAVSEEYLASRTGQVRRFGEYMAGLGIPVIQPFGGHAVYIDIDEFFRGTPMKRDDFGGIALTGLLLLKGVRLCELGAFAFGKWNPETKREEFKGNNFVRCAVPRNKYETEDLRHVADCVKGLHKRREEIPAAIPVYGRDLPLRHFKARFELR